MTYQTVRRYIACATNTLPTTKWHRSTINLSGQIISHLDLQWHSSSPCKIGYKGRRRNVCWNVQTHLSSAKLNLSKQAASSKLKLSEVNNIMDWIECFGIIAIMARSSLQRVADLIGYHSLIMSASQKRLGHLRQKIPFESFSNQEHRVVSLTKSSLTPQ